MPWIRQRSWCLKAFFSSTSAISAITCVPSSFTVVLYLSSLRTSSCRGRSRCRRSFRMANGRSTAVFVQDVLWSPRRRAGLELPSCPKGILRILVREFLTCRWLKLCPSCKFSSNSLSRLSLAAWRRDRGDRRLEYPCCRVLREGGRRDATGPDDRCEVLKAC